MDSKIYQSGLRRITYWVVLAALAVGIALLPYHPEAALFPAAAVFGWSQIGGL